MARLVKCKYCGISFDRDTEEWVTVGNRYAHSSCVAARLKSLEQRKQEEELERAQNINQYHEVLDFAKNNIENPNYALIQKQLRDFIDNKGYSYSGICKTLTYCKDIAKLKFNQGNGGIGIVPYYYDKAKAYYYQLYITTKQNEAKEVKVDTIEVKTSLGDVRDKPHHRGFTFLDEEV